MKHNESEIAEMIVYLLLFLLLKGPTWPNRMYTLSGTSMGSTSTGTWYMDKPGFLFPQRTILDQVESAGLEAKNYYNDTPWEMFMESIAHHPERTSTMTQFFEDAGEHE